VGLWVKVYGIGSSIRYWLGSTIQKAQLQYLFYRGRDLAGSVADPDPFDTDPTFRVDTDLDPVFSI
jgi:hypothetical protein